jgi:hypothetical protein
LFYEKNSCASEVLESQGRAKGKKTGRRIWKGRGCSASWYY